MVLALNHLSTFYGENTLNNRLNLRGELESQCFNVHSQFLRDYSEIQKVRALPIFSQQSKHLDVVEKDILDMKSQCDKMQTRLDETLDMSGTLIKRAGNIFQARFVKLKGPSNLLSDKNAVQKQVITAFLDHFQLTSQQVAALQVQTIKSIDFFNALKAAHRIYKDCHVLLHS